MKTEHEEQREFVMWFRQNHVDIRIFAIPNGGSRNLITASALKSEGVSPGVPDLYIPAWKLWIEMKRSSGGSLSAHQKDWIKHLSEIGDTVIVGHGRDDAIRKIQEWKAGKS